MVTQWGIDAGRNYRLANYGEALAEIGTGERVFLTPDNYPIKICAAKHFDEAKSGGEFNSAVAVAQLAGRCDLHRFLRGRRCHNACLEDLDEL